MNFSIVGGVNSSNANLTASAVQTSGGTTYSSSSGSGYFFGALFTNHFSHLLSLELGIIYEHDQMGLTVANSAANMSVNLTEHFSRLQVPLVLRAHLIPSFFNVGVGGYWSTSIGNVSVDSSNQSIFTSKSTGSFFDLGLLPTDLGAIGSVQITIPLMPMFKILIEGRYLIGLRNDTNDPVNNYSSYKTNEWMIAAGPQISFF